jgi:hypothetical protein
VIINVTQEDIDKGIPKECGKCPVALAIKRAGNFEFVSVDGCEIYIDGSDFACPNEVDFFIRDFDTGGPSAVFPFSFELTRVQDEDEDHYGGCDCVGCSTL